MSTLGIYFLTDGFQHRSYIGYSTDVMRRYRTHKLKLKAAARYTKSFQGGCLFWACIVGFPSKRSAMSAEWHAKRRSRRRRRPADDTRSHVRFPHHRLRSFFQILKHPKFTGPEFQQLKIYTPFPESDWMQHVKDEYNIPVVRVTH